MAYCHMTSPRKGFYLGGIPVSLQGIGGPGAPHYFLLQKRCDAGAEALNMILFGIAMFAAS